MSLQESGKSSNSSATTIITTLRSTRSAYLSLRFTTPIGQLLSDPETAEQTDETNQTNNPSFSLSPQRPEPTELGDAGLKNTTEDPFTAADAMSRSNSRQAFTERFDLYRSRQWPSTNARSDFYHISRSHSPSSDFSEEIPTSPTHKPRRAHISMNRRQEPNMPSGDRSFAATQSAPIPSNSSAYMPPSSQFSIPQIPQYLTAEQSFNTSSSGSQESVMTQAPGHFHAGARGNFAIQGYNNNGYAAATGYGAPAPFATPVLTSDGTFQQQPNRGGLNPASASFQPNMYSANTNANNSAASGFFNSSFGSNASSGHDSVASSAYHPASQIGNASPYSPYGGVSLSGTSGPSGGQQQNAIQYGNEYGVAPSGYGYGTTSNFNSYNPHGGNQGYASQTHAPGYGNGGSSHAGTSYAGTSYAGSSYAGSSYAGNSYAGNSYQGMGYGDGRNNTSAGAGYQNRPSQFPEYQNQNRQSAVHGSHESYNLPANANRGKPANFRGNNGNNSFKQRNHHRPSNLATAPVMNANSAPRYNLHQPAGSARLPPAVQAPSPSRSRMSEESRVSSDAVHQPVYAIPNRGQGNPTPQLRSRRGQAISINPSQTAATANWVEEVSSGVGVSSDAQNFQGYPPKMVGLAVSASVDSGEISLPKSIDPIIAAPVFLPPFNNPFEPTLQQIIPYKNGGFANSNDGPTREMRLLTENGTRKPTAAEALDTKNLPLAEYCRLATEDTWGVVRIKNIPYSVNRPEILAFLGRNAKIPSESEHEPVHIVMERVTSKTLDAFVEFVSFDEATNAVKRFETNRSSGRGGRLGQRHVDVELSSQEQQMKELFPKAKNVTWHGSRPVITPRDPTDRYNSGFQGFVSKEELVMLVKHVEAPQRSPFSQDCAQRPFECLISTLLKYPWYMVDYITIEDRHLLHNTTVQLISLLRTQLGEDTAAPQLTPMLLKRVWRAALRCPGFSPTQRDDIIYAAGLDLRESIEHAVPPFAAEWKTLFTIGPKPGMPYDVVYYYAATIREATEKKDHMSLAEKAALGIEDQRPKLFGNLGAYIGLPTNHEEFIHMTLGQVAAKEWAGIEQALIFALT